MNLATIAANLATRFSNVTPPSGYGALHECTHLLPTAVTSTPTLVVFPPDIELEAAGGPTRFGIATFPVRVYIGLETDLPNAIAATYAWYDAFQDLPLGDIDLGGLAYVIDAFTTGGRLGTLKDYSGNPYIGIEYEVRVRIAEGIPVTA